MTFLTFFLFSCSIGNQSPPAPSSPAAQALQQVQVIEQDSQALYKQAHALESWIDEARRNVEKGQNKEQQVQKMNALMKKLETQNASLQQKISQLEKSLQAPTH